MREKPLAYRFTAADFDLVSTTEDQNAKDSIRFREGGRRPIPNTDLTVNYYPVQTPAVPVNDLNVGSVVRNMMETVAVEMALTYQNIDAVYKSAFIDTAEGSSLDKVVALVGVKRLGSGYPVANSLSAPRGRSRSNHGSGQHRHHRRCRASLSDQR